MAKLIATVDCINLKQVRELFEVISNMMEDPRLPKEVKDQYTKRISEIKFE